jgi:hypothetical protein
MGNAKQFWGQMGWKVWVKMAKNWANKLKEELKEKLQIINPHLLHFF